MKKPLKTKALKKKLKKNKKDLVRDIELTNTKFWSTLQLGSQLQSS